MSNASQSRKLRQEARKAGLCSRCRRVPASKSVCDGCRAYIVAWTAAKRSRLLTTSEKAST